MVLKVLIPIVSLLLISCGSSPQQTSAAKQIVGADDRVVTNDYANLVGSLSVNGVKVCTAYASYTNEITTAAHCISEKIPVKQYTFEFINGRKFNVEAIYYLNDKNDLARLTVVGIVDYLTEAKPSNSSLTMISFAPDKSKFVKTQTTNNLALKDGNHILLHDMDSLSGASGSPILQDGRVIGIHLGAYQELNVGVVLYNIQGYAFSDRVMVINESWLSKAAKHISVKDVAKGVGTIIDATTPSAISTALTPSDTGMDPGEKERLDGVERNRQVQEHDNRSREADAYDRDRGACLTGY